MFRRVQRVLVAVSGGPDSLACLLILRELGAREGFEVHAAHFDHQLRADSRNDLEYVRQVCADLGVEFVSGEGDVASVAKQQRAGIEETARQMRYQFLAFVAGKENADCLATGHTADDQAETVLMRILRGTGIRGLRGMLPVSGIPGASAQRLVRPLLVLARADTEAVCNEAAIRPLSDSSNEDPSYTRNRIRSDTLPALRRINPSADEALRELAEHAREAFAEVERKALETRPMVRGPIGAVYALADLRPLPGEALTSVIEREAAFSKVDVRWNRTRIANLKQVLNRGDGIVVFGECVVEASCGKVRIGPALEPPESFEPTVLNIPGSTRCGPWRVDVALEPLDALPESTLLAIDQQQLRGLLRLRPVERGDRIRFHGQTKQLSDLFIDEKVPRWDRTNAVVIADATGARAVVGAFGVLSDVTVESSDSLFVRISRFAPAVPRIERLDAASEAPR